MKVLVDFLGKKEKPEKSVVKAVLGLLKYEIQTQEELKNVSGTRPSDKKEFRDTLTAKGVPDAICDLLFKEYVVEDVEENSTGKRRASGGDGVADAKRQCIDQDSTGAMDLFIRDLNNGESLEIDGNVFIRFNNKLLGLTKNPPVELRGTRGGEHQLHDGQYTVPGDSTGSLGEVRWRGALGAGRRRWRDRRGDTPQSCRNDDRRRH